MWEEELMSLPEGLATNNPDPIQREYCQTTLCRRAGEIEDCKLSAMSWDAEVVNRIVIAAVSSTEFSMSM